MSAPTRPAARSAAPVDLAVVVATAPAGDMAAALAPLEDGTVLSRLVTQLTELGVRRTVVFTRPEWERDVQAAIGDIADIRAHDSPADELRTVAELSRAAAGPVLLAYGDVVTHASALEGLITDPKVSTAVLAGSRRRHIAFRVQARRGRVIAAATPYHTVRRANATFLGVLRVAPAQLPTLAAAAERLAELAGDVPRAWEEELVRKAARWRVLMSRSHGVPEGDDRGDDYAAPDESEEPPEAEGDGTLEALTEEHEELLANRLAAAPRDTVALLLLGLVREGAPVQSVYLRRLFWSRPLSTAAVSRTEARIAELDEDRLLLDSAVKGADGFFTTFFVSPYSRYIARWAARRGLTPNQVTLASLVIGVLAAAAFADGERWGLVAGAVLLQAAFTTDCVDGQLARYTRQFSKFGAWLDSMLDRTKEFLVFGGLAIGASRAGDPVWLLACCALVLQTVRHTSDASHASLQREGTAAVRQPPLEQPLDHAGAAAEARRTTTAPPPPRRRSLAARVLSLWSRLDDVRVVRWLKRMAAFPIGERFAVISITAALFSPRVTFVALLAWGGFAIVYTHSGRILRAIR
jgi:CDP-alcohol phosphatidyltransferase